MTPGEQYWLTTPDGRVPLPGTLKPDTYGGVAPAPNLVRGRGQRRQYDLSDGLPAASAITLAGEVVTPSELALSALLSTLRRNVRRATALDRDGRHLTPLQGGHLLAVPGMTGHSGHASLTLTLVPTHIRDPEAVDFFDF